MPTRIRPRQKPPARVKVPEVSPARARGVDRQPRARRKGRSVMTRLSRRDTPPLAEEYRRVHKPYLISVYAGVALASPRGAESADQRECPPRSGPLRPAAATAPVTAVPGRPPRVRDPGRPRTP